MIEPASYFEDSLRRTSTRCIPNVETVVIEDGDDPGGIMEVEIYELSDPPIIWGYHPVGGIDFTSDAIESGCSFWSCG